MSQINYIIVDDEPIAHEIIEDYCANLPHLHLKANCYNAFQAMEQLSSKPIDLMFLDINMPKLKGFELLKTLSNPPQVIVTTAYSEFALEGYELDICDYLLKPFSFSRFAKAVNKAIASLQDSPTVPISTPQEVPTDERIFLKEEKKHHQVLLGDILYIEAYGNYSKVYLRDTMILTSQKISVFEQSLPKSRLLRVHKSFIVGIDHIKLIEGNQITVGNFKVPIGKVYKHNVNELL